MELGRAEGELSAGPVIAVALTSTGRELCRAVVGHGVDPADALLSAGARALRPTTARCEGGAVRIDFRAEPASRVPLAHPAPRTDPSLVREPGEAAVAFQRLAAYAIVESPRGMLLTIATSRAHAGVWALPGGGVEPGEEPGAACRRELWEETGQEVHVGPLLQVQSDHWIGRAPSGRLEDFHAIRLIYRASCPMPGDPVVQEVGGTTVRAAWIPGEQLAGADLSRPVRTALRR